MIKFRPTRVVSIIRSQTKKRVVVPLICFVIAITGVLLPFQPQTAQAQPGGLESISGLSSGFGDNQSTCAIQQIGWVVCPVMRAIARLADYGFAFINQNYLKIESNISNSKSGTFKAWEVMRNIADALFVIAFLAIIYSQITGRNSGGYNIKRILPRLIFAAILVNVSYYICAFAIELSNIIGNSIFVIMDTITKPIGQAAMSLTSAENGFSDSRLTDITSGILTKTSTVWILLAPVAAVTIGIAVICAAGIVLLIMRKVVVAMLVLASPIIFVLYLLPNTERYFQQWARLFFQLLLLYPIIAFLLGTGQIISATIINVGTSTDANYRVKDDSYNARNGGSGSATTDLAAAGAAVLPLLGVWFLLKSLTNVATSAGSKVAGSIGRGAGKDQQDKLKAKMEAQQKQTTSGATAGLPTFERKPAFSRLSRRHRATPGGSSLPGTNTGTGGSSRGTASASGGQPASMFDRLTGNVNGANVTSSAADEQSKKLEEVNNAKIASAEAENAKTALNQQDEKKNKTAKDIFNNMNKSRQMGGGNSGSSSGNSGNTGNNNGQVTSGDHRPVAPGGNYAAPSVAQGGNQGGSSKQPQVGNANPTIIAVPVQVDASSFLNKDTAKSPNGAEGMTQPPTSDTEIKAKARAQKYIFDSATEVEKADDKLDLLKELEADRKRKEQGNKEDR